MKLCCRDFIWFYISFPRRQPCVGLVDQKLCQASSFLNRQLQTACLWSWACTYAYKSTWVQLNHIMPKYRCWSCSWSIKRLPMSNLARQQHSQQEHITWSHGCWILFVQPSSNDDSLASFACLNEFCISKTLQALWTNSGTICWLPRCKVSWNFSCLIQLQVVTTKAQKHEASNLKNTCRLKASEAIHTNKSNYVAQCSQKSPSYDDVEVVQGCLSCLSAWCRENVQDSQSSMEKMHDSHHMFRWT